MSFFILTQKHQQPVSVLSHAQPFYSSVYYDNDKNDLYSIIIIIAGRSTEKGGSNEQFNLLTNCFYHSVVQTCLIYLQIYLLCFI